MKGHTHTKHHLANFLILVGVIAMLLPIFTTLRIRYIQAQMLEQHEPPATDLPSEDECEAALPSYDPANIVPPTAFDEAYTIRAAMEQNTYLARMAAAQKEAAEKKEPLKREEYTDGAMTIHIPAIDVYAAVVNGTTRPILKKGPGLYEDSPLPDEEGANVLIAGHRTTYGAWFRHVDKLKNGDEIVLELDGVQYLYKVEKVFVVAKNDWSVTEPTGYAALTLTACHPVGSSRQRIVVRARLEGTDNG